MTTPERRPGPLPPRRFNLGDIAILIVAAAVFFALARYAWEHRLPADVGWTFYSPASTLTLAGPADTSATCLEIAGTGLVVASLTLVVLRLRRPRPPIRRLMRQPGLLAVLAASIAAGVAFAHDRLQDLLGLLELAASNGTGLVSIGISRFTIFPDGTTLVGFVAVLSAWLVLRWDGRWQSERSWLDRLGRLVGWAWLLQPLGQFYYRLMAFFA